VELVTITRPVEHVAVLTLTRPEKKNALSIAIRNEVTDALGALAADESVRAVVLTGAGNFFSFGFDIPAFLSFSRERFTEFLVSFNALCTKLFLFPKPVVAAINGHAIAGGCMLAIACDVRVMAQGRPKISLNEVTFGASVFSGTVTMLNACAGERNAHTILSTGEMYDGAAALCLGLVDRVVPADNLMDEARKQAVRLSHPNADAFRSIKHLMRRPSMRRALEAEAESIRQFVDCWYSETTWARLREIKIHP